MEIARCTKSDYDQVLAHIHEFWNNDRTLPLHHPMFLHEFGDSAYVIRDGALVAAYLFGFFSQTGPVAYVHLVGVRAPYRRRGLGRSLYDHFAADALARGCTELKAITTPGNRESIAFHESVGMESIGVEEKGFRVAKDYAGPGQDRVVFRKSLRVEASRLKRE